MGDVQMSPWRMEVSRLPSGAMVINDSYNANPMSMHAAIDALLSVPARRRIAVIGVMAELGADSAAQHAAIAHRLRAEGVEIIAVGVPEYGGLLVEDVDRAAAVLGELGDDTAVLIKASRVAQLERLVELLA